MSEPDGNDVELAGRLLKALRPEPRPFYEVEKGLTKEDLEDRRQIYACLVRLKEAGLIDLVSGKGWYLLRKEEK